jgi:hypothetical protein
VCLENIQPIRLPRFEDGYQSKWDGAFALISGWGVTEGMFINHLLKKKNYFVGVLNKNKF